jgi:SAM-dependent MidA family methyltransferase
LNAQTSNRALVELMRSEISTAGPQPFAWFMQQALYHPQHGYYSSDRAVIGRHGDFFTNVSVGPLFGQLLAAQFTQIWERLAISDSAREQRSDKFVVVEQGAHHGHFARDVLEAVRRRAPEFFAALRYRIVEASPILQDRQFHTLGEFADRVEWRQSLDELEPFVGIHFSNELLDSMPAHLLVSKARSDGLPGWREKFVALNGDDFEFVDRPIVDSTLQSLVEKLPVHPEGYETEINVAALDWIDKLSAKLVRGCVMTVDYGFPFAEFYAPYRSSGTLQVRAQHRYLASPFERVGLADITTHVDWTSLAQRAEACGLHVHGFTDQHHFITGIISELLRDDFEQAADAKAKRALQTLLHPEMLGRAFQVMALEKEGDCAGSLAGYKFASDPRAALGL